MAGFSDRWPAYVSVAERRRAAEAFAKAEAGKGRVLLPVSIEGRAIATTFWGKAWCEHLEKFSDYANRLPRGRTYARNGSVIHLEIDTGKITAMVYGSDTYHINIAIAPLPADKWDALKAECVGGVDSALELLQGKLSSSIMQTVCDRDNGLFPAPAEIGLDCNCPDWADLCKHLAAVLYGVGARLDQSPELLFQLRGVDYRELIGAELAIDTTASGTELTGDLSGIFGIDIDTTADLDSIDSGFIENSATAKGKRIASKARRKVQARKAKPKPISDAASSINISRGIRASHIVKLRKQHQLTQQDLAGLTGKSVATICRWEERTGVLKLQAASQRVLRAVFQKTPQQIDRAMKRKRQ